MVTTLPFTSAPFPFTEALPPETLWVTLSRCPGHENWRAVTVEGVDLT